MTRGLSIVTFFTALALTGAQEPTLVRAAAAEPLLPLVFERKDGQAPGQYRFLARRFAYDVGFGAERITVEWKDATVGRHVSLRFAGAHVRQPEGEGALPGTTNYVHGNDPSRWHLNVPTFERVRYAQQYDGVSAVF